ncbi:MAG: hypothetical protein ACYC69_00110 [Thermodesulfovibrionales bacterium]
MRTIEKCQRYFILYFIVIATIPYSHNHTDSEPYRYCSAHPACSAECGVFSVPDVSNDRYSDSHTSYDDRHLHFLAEDSNPALRPTAINEAAPLKDVTISEMAIVQLSKQSIIAMVQDRDRSYSEVFHSPYSGLSPPSC